MTKSPLVIYYLKAIFIRILMVLTALRYLNYFRSFSFLNIDMSKSLQTQNHDDVRCHDSSKLVNADSLIIAFFVFNRINYWKL